MPDLEVIRLTPDSKNFYDRTLMLASGAVEQLEGAWQRPVRHNTRIERGALWYALMLDAQYDEALQDGDQPTLLTPPGVNTQTHYGLQAGLRTVSYGLPFTPSERSMLRPPDMLDEWKFEKAEALHRRAPDQVARWHQWLWTTRREGQRTIAEPSLDAAVLAEGCSHLAQSLAVVLR